jgi:protein TonB
MTLELSILSEYVKKGRHNKPFYSELFGVVSKDKLFMNTSQIIQRKLSFTVAPFEDEKTGKSDLAEFIEENWKEFYKTKKDAIEDWNKIKSRWMNSTFTTSDAVIFHPDGSIKIIPDYLTNRQIAQKPISEEEYFSLKGKELKKHEIGKINDFLSEDEARSNLLWKLLSRNQSLLDNFVDYVFSDGKKEFRYNTAMGIFPKIAKENSLEMRLWRVRGVGNRSSLDAMEINDPKNNFVGAIPEVMKFYLRRDFKNFDELRKKIETTDRDYGASPLKQFAQKYTGIGLALAIALHLVGIGAFWGLRYFSREEENKAPIVMLKYSELGPPPSITNQQAIPQIALSTPMAKPNIGIPVPVPDAQVSPEQTIATQQELSKIAGPVVQSTGGSSIGVSFNPNSLKVEDNTPPPDFVPVEKEPAVIKNVTPKYPELAQRAGIEGRVWVKVWVDKTGKPRKAVILKSDAEIFNQAAEAAAMQDRFTPAIMNRGPVDVWIVIPFTFKLQK